MERAEITEFGSPMLSEEQLRKKERRFLRIVTGKQKLRRLRDSLIRDNRFKPSIFVRTEYDRDRGRFVYTDRIRRGHGSKAQKWMKKTSSHMVRRCPLEEMPFKGNHYRRIFDYWGTWM